MGMSQLRRLDGFLKRRAAIAAYYQETLHGLGLVLPAAPGGRTHAFYRFVVRVPHAKADMLEALMDRLAKRGIRCRRPVFRPIHHYLKADGFPVSDDAYASALSIPIYPSLTDQEMKQTANTLHEVLS
jgi:dTDP-4-amino-4,6-dideoxygalactose transaminase